MIRGQEGIPRTRDLNPYFFRIFWESISKANKARATLRKVYWQQHNDSQSTVPIAQTDQAEIIISNSTSSAVKTKGTTSDSYSYARTHVKILEEQTLDFELDPSTSKPKGTSQ